MLDRFFRLSGHQSSVSTEILAGVTTFLTMAYIIVVQPAVLSGVCLEYRPAWILGPSRQPPAWRRPSPP